MEICICAAVKIEDGTIMRGQRHSDCLRSIWERKKKPATEVDAQGFITSTGRFVTRAEGRKLQDEAGIPSSDPEGYKGSTLFSEDIY